MVILYVLIRATWYLLLRGRSDGYKESSPLVVLTCRYLVLFQRIVLKAFHSFTSDFYSSYI